MKNGKTAIETKSTLEHCSFEENPLFIIWNKPNYQIVFTLNEHDLLTPIL